MRGWLVAAAAAAQAVNSSRRASCMRAARRLLWESDQNIFRKLLFIPLMFFRLVKASLTWFMFIIIYFSMNSVFEMALGSLGFRSARRSVRSAAAAANNKCSTFLAPACLFAASADDDEIFTMLLCAVHSYLPPPPTAPMATGLRSSSLTCS